MDFTRSMKINLRDGRELELQLTPQLLEKIRQTFGLPTIDDVGEMHVKEYLVSSMRHALREETDVVPVA